MIPFSLNLGEFTVARIYRPAIVEASYFLEIDPAVVEAVPRPQLREARVGIAYVESCPMNAGKAFLCRVPDGVRYIARRYNHYYTEVRGTFDEYLGGFDRKRRHELRRTVRRFKEFSKGQIDFRQYGEPQQVPEFCRYARELSAKTYQERLLDRGFPGGDEYADRLTRLAETGALLGFVLFHTDQPIAYMYGFLEKGGVCSLRQMGYDPAYREWSPGNVLHYLVVQTIFHDTKVAVIDYSEGEGYHKSLFSNCSVMCADVYLLEGRFADMVAVLAHAAASKLSRLGVRASAALGVKAFIKDWIRRHA
jgi:CelD/BcsL family acetyltransferase involved in cellulose biosynthesis